MNQIKKQIHLLVEKLIQDQKSNGSWSFCFENGPITDSYMILLMITLAKRDSSVMKVLNRIIKMQSSDGSWKLYPDENPGNISATIEACLALLYCGKCAPDDPIMQKAKGFIMKHGGLQKANRLTKILLSLFGHQPWPSIPLLPIECLLLPTSNPYNLFNIVGYARVHLVPLMILAHQKLQIDLPHKNEVDQWLSGIPINVTEEEPLIHRKQIAHHFTHSQIKLEKLALQQGLDFMIKHTEIDGTLYSYTTSTFFMVFALHSLGYPFNHMYIQKAYNGLVTFLFPLDEGIYHLQETSSTVWDTSLLVYTLQQAGLPAEHPTIKKGIQYLLKRQQVKKGDWSIHNPYSQPGGWGFSDINTINPDIDDTSACLRALTPSTYRVQSIYSAWKRGVQWLLFMQNPDGGWPAFEKQTDPIWFRVSPKLRHVLADPSNSDLTGRTLEFLGNFTDQRGLSKPIEHACRWLFQHQQKDGSWYGRWGICYIYGTWAALTGLSAVGYDHTHPQVKKAVAWLSHIQNPDGGWGESCDSDRQQKFIPLGRSTTVQTAWALDALISVTTKPTKKIQAGIKYLLQRLSDPTIDDYPTGAGFAGQFYIRYHAYPFIWPLLTLSHYYQRYS
ncbi:sporulene cyclase [Seinonella peptonophila]|uniref:Sporulene cyclase n=1 Tax=Seinonella peptonophila TaxID=112248 RepID=A0A1M5BAW7_9BACL|nr:squalene--hopene cyclase [Seinonella peptonophila]SHF39588.1 sporulene cyclase [Seinonella peptonophila]